jgi:SAM-dependent methyltransferase
MVTLYPSAVDPRDSRQWDREADLQSIRSTYETYGAGGRARLWDARVQGYGRLVRDLQASLLRVIEASVPDSGARVVDLGCGDGTLAGDADAARAGWEWIGVDLRPEAIAAARDSFPGHSFVVASADAVPLDSTSVDVIVARLLFSSLPSSRLERAVAAEVGRLLRPGGWLVWLDLRYANPMNSAVHGLPTSRIAGLFPGWNRELRSAGLLPPLARRLGRATPVAYPALTALPVLRSHLVGRLQRPANVAA